MRPSFDIKYYNGQNVFLNVGRNVVMGRIMGAKRILKNKQRISYLVCVPKPGAQIRQAKDINDKRYFQWVWETADKLYSSYIEAQIKKNC